MGLAFSIAAAAAVVCSVKWFRTNILLYTMVWYMVEQDIKPPDGEDVARISKKVLRHQIKDLLHL